MRSGKSYLAVHTSWENPYPDTTCPHFSVAPQSLEHAILFCPSSARQRSRLLQGVSDIGREAPIWSVQQMLISLAEFIRLTTTPPLPLPSVTQPYPFSRFPACPESLSSVRSPYISIISLGYSATHIGHVGGKLLRLFLLWFII